MGEFIGLDVSLKETAVFIRRSGKRIWRGKCASDPALLAELIRKRAPEAERVVFETGPLAVWFYHELTGHGLPAICIDARRLVKDEVMDWIAFYNHRRLHSTLGYTSPMAFEKKWLARQISLAA